MSPHSVAVVFMVQLEYTVIMASCNKGRGRGTTTLPSGTLHLQSKNKIVVSTNNLVTVVVYYPSHANSLYSYI